MKDFVLPCHCYTAKIVFEFFWVEMASSLQAEFRENVNICGSLEILLRSADVLNFGRDYGKWKLCRLQLLCNVFSLYCDSYSGSYIVEHSLCLDNKNVYNV